MRQSFTISMIALIFITLGCGGGAAQGGLPGSAASPFFRLRLNRLHRRDQPCRGQIQFTQNSYLLEGAQKISALGSSSIFNLSDPFVPPRPGGRATGCG